MKIAEQHKEFQMYERDEKNCKNPTLLKQAQLVHETASLNNDQVDENVQITQPLLGDRSVQKFSPIEQKCVEKQPTQPILSGKTIQKFSPPHKNTPSTNVVEDTVSETKQHASDTLKKLKKPHIYSPWQKFSQSSTEDGYLKSKVKQTQKIWQASKPFINRTSHETRSLYTPSRTMVDEFHDNKKEILFQGEKINYTALVKYTLRKNAFEAESLKWLFPIDPGFTEIQGHPDEQMIKKKRQDQIKKSFQLLTKILGYRYNPQTNTLHLEDSRSVQRERIHFLRKNAMAEFSLNKILDSLDSHGLHKEKGLLKEALALSFEDEEQTTTHTKRLKDRVKRSIQTEGRICVLIVSIAYKIIKLGF